MTARNIAVIRENYPKLWNDFVISTSPTKLLELISNEEITLSGEELSSLLEDSRVSITTALNLVDTSEETISIKGKSYPPIVKAKIVGSFFNSNETSILLQSFDQEDSLVREAFLPYAKNHTDLIMTAAKTD